MTGKTRDSGGGYAGPTSAPQATSGGGYAGPTTSTGTSSSGQDAAFLAAAGVVNPTNTSGAGSDAGLGLGTAGGKLQVQVGSLFGTGPATMTLDDALRTFNSLAPDKKAQIQAYLYKAGGFYASGVKISDINLGVVGPKDLDALRKALLTAGQSQGLDANSNPTPVNFDDYLRRQAAFGVLNGTISAAQARAGGHVAGDATHFVYQRENAMKLADELDATFKDLTGRHATDAEKTAFVAAYQQMDRARQFSQWQGVYGSQAAQDLGTFSTAPPTYQPMDENAGDVGENMRFAAAAAGPNTLTGQLTTKPVGVNPLEERAVQQYNIYNQNLDAAVRDQQNLAWADAPLPGMAANSSGGGFTSSTVDQQYDPQSYAEQWVRSRYAPQVGGHNAATAFATFLNLIHGGGQG